AAEGNSARRLRQDRPAVLITVVKNTILLAGAWLAIALTGGLAVHAQETPPSEYQLKAAFLYNFAKFVEWPAAAFPEPATPFTIGVIGENPFDDQLEQTVRNKNINGHAFSVRQIRSLSEVKSCHILFISASERRR